jgi:hypothetical protein
MQILKGETTKKEEEKKKKNINKPRIIPGWMLFQR